MYRHTTTGTPTSQIEQTPLLSTEWNQAIREAKAKIKQLQYTIRVFKELRDAGEPWPRQEDEKIIPTRGQPE